MTAPTRYLVHVQVDWIYEIDADTPEDAAQSWVDDPPAYTGGECTGYSIDRVTTKDNPDTDDLRAPLPCRGGCGKWLPAYQNDECPECLLARLERQQAERAAAGL